ncbi:cGMP-specific 3',5'-cyclic phosphodiesterase [Caerostris extrusa]|uniref:cGMP-specific 3',5'-cyclic phosphodiesterase n=1 Tax=Caerostris extrusa TaxID=172846 RepID=A0AAV4YDX5_CAEEX|nr:cGMP-specific 3',5'-cyclic phosphodiesterase [Caerostris extrusa]
MKRKIRVPWDKGIVGYVAKCREPLNIPDCYMDDRCNSLVDLRTGYKTHNMLCMPILDADGEVKGVAQVINKRHGKEPFAEADMKIQSPKCKLTASAMNPFSNGDNVTGNPDRF